MVRPPLATSYRRALQKPDPHNASQIHSYAYSGKGKIGVLGRKNEQEKLRRFLNPGKNFLWLQVAGAAGQGKSRLGWELIQHARKELCWQAGFWAIPTNLEAKDNVDEFIAFWNNWSPDKPHLLVVDYVIGFGSVLGPMIQQLILRSETFDHPVRLLILERQRWDRGGFLNNTDDLGAIVSKAEVKRYFFRLQRENLYLPLLSESAARLRVL